MRPRAQSLRRQYNGDINGNDITVNNPNFFEHTHDNAGDNGNNHAYQHCHQHNGPAGVPGLSLRIYRPLHPSDEFGVPRGSRRC